MEVHCLIASARKCDICYELGFDSPFPRIHGGILLFTAEYSYGRSFVYRIHFEHKQGPLWIDSSKLVDIVFNTHGSIFHCLEWGYTLIMNLELSCSRSYLNGIRSLVSRVFMLKRGRGCLLL